MCISCHGAFRSARVGSQAAFSGSPAKAPPTARQLAPLEYGLVRQPHGVSAVPSFGANAEAVAEPGALCQVSAQWSKPAASDGLTTAKYGETSKSRGTNRLW